MPTIDEPSDHRISPSVSPSEYMAEDPTATIFIHNDTKKSTFSLGKERFFILLTCKQLFVNKFMKRWIISFVIY